MTTYVSSRWAATGEDEDRGWGSCRQLTKSRTQLFNNGVGASVLGLDKGGRR
eukprot:m.102509 g.102509  ORF g.102509 m.102509 type:complete len:52 (-) comp12541_c0_seq1:90-245(-)